MKVTVPTSYESITIKQYHEYSLMLERKLEPLESIAHTISIMCNVEYQDVRAFDITSLKRIYAEMDFLNKEVHQSVLKTTLKIKDSYFKIFEIDKLSFGQYTTVKELIKSSGVGSMANLCACFITKIGNKWSDEEYFSNSELFYENMSVQDAHNTMVFFCNLYNELNLITQDYFIKEAQAQIDLAIQAFKTHGDGQ